MNERMIARELLAAARELTAATWNERMLREGVVIVLPNGFEVVVGRRFRDRHGPAVEVTDERGKKYVKGIDSFLTWLRSTRAKPKVAAEESQRERRAGTWGLPRTDRDVTKLVNAVRKMEGGQWDMTSDGEPSRAFYKLLGDDDFFDDIGKAEKDFLKAVADLAKRRLKKFVKRDREDFGDPGDYDRLVAAANQLGVRASARGFVAVSAQTRRLRKALDAYGVDFKRHVKSFFPDMKVTFSKGKPRKGGQFRYDWHVLDDGALRYGVFLEVKEDGDDYEFIWTWWEHNPENTARPIMKTYMRRVTFDDAMVGLMEPREVNRALADAMRGPRFEYHEFHKKGDLHRNVLLNTLEDDYGITFRDYDLSTTGIRAKNSKTEKILEKLFR